MTNVTMAFGGALIVLGIVGYLGSAPTPESANANTDAVGDVADENSASELDQDSVKSPPKKSITALFPMVFGVALLVCGVLALKESRVKHAMHAAAMVGLLGTLLGAGRGAMGLGKFFSGDPSLNQRSFLFVWLMTLLCGVFVFLCVQSFRAVRKQRLAET